MLLTPELARIAGCRSSRSGGLSTAGAVRLPCDFALALTDFPATRSLGIDAQWCDTCGPGQRRINTRDRVRRFREKNRG